MKAKTLRKKLASLGVAIVQEDYCGQAQYRATSPTNGTQILLWTENEDKVKFIHPQWGFASVKEALVQFLAPPPDPALECLWKVHKALSAEKSPAQKCDMIWQIMQAYQEQVSK